MLALILAASFNFVGQTFTNDVPCGTAHLFESGRCILPSVEMCMALNVASEYKLNREQAALLIAIRKFENGRPGLEFGVGGPMDSGHPAHKYTDGIQSFLCQARWAAGTIRRRYTGDLAAFDRRYCPYHAKKWEEGVRWNLIKALNDKVFKAWDDKNYFDKAEVK